MKDFRPTQSDVARLAGVSRQTVSLVINQDPRVSDERRNAVLTAMRELGYRPNAAARQLASRTSDTIGIICSDLLNPFIAEQIEALRRMATAAHFSVVVYPVDENAESEGLALNRLVETGAAGVVMVSPQADRKLLEEYGQLLSIVVLGRKLRVPSVSFVRPADFSGAASVTQHLIDQRYDPILFVGPLRSNEGDSSQERFGGYAKAMQEHQEEPLRIVTEADYSAEIVKVLDDFGAGTAFVCHNDKIALDVAAITVDYGLSLGTHIGVAGYDNSYLSQYSGIRLTTVDMRIQMMAKLCIDVMRDMLEGQTQDVDVVVEPTLVVRESTERDS